MKELKIAWLYNDILNLYGDGGNIDVLKYLLKTNHIPFIIDEISLNNKQDISDYDILFLGGGSDAAQNLIYHDLLNRRDQIQNILDNNGFILAICGGYQLFGQGYLDQHGNYIEGLKFFNYTTAASTKRMNDNIITKINLNNKNYQIVGYENHAGETTNIDSPFGSILYGSGNSFSTNNEGFMKKNFIGTYIHGPLLPKNPEIAKYIIEYVLREKYNLNISIEIKLKFAHLAKEKMIERLLK